MVSTGSRGDFTERRVVFTERRCVSTETGEVFTGMGLGFMPALRLDSGSPYLHENFLRVITKSDLLWNSFFDRQQPTGMKKYGKWRFYTRRRFGA